MRACVPSPGPSGPHATGGPEETEVFVRGQQRGDAAQLRGVTDARDPLDDTRRGADHAGADPEQRGLPGAVGTDHGGDLAGPQLQVDTAENLASPVALRDGSQPQHHLSPAAVHAERPGLCHVKGPDQGGGVGDGRPVQFLRVAARIPGLLHRVTGQSVRLGTIQTGLDELPGQRPSPFPGHRLGSSLPASAVAPETTRSTASRKLRHSSRRRDASSAPRGVSS